MKLENQVTNLELSKKLKELGVKQESLFWWVGSKNDEWFVMSLRSDEKDLMVGGKEGRKEGYSAFTVAELGEMLPKQFGTTKDHQDRWYVYNRIGYEEQYADTEANARAKMLIYLIENKLMQHV
jgi:hypothetical protein